MVYDLTAIDSRGGGHLVRYVGMIHGYEFVNYLSRIPIVRKALH